MRRSTLLALSLAPMLLASGCHLWARWDAPTTYEFVGLRPSQSVYVEDVFRSRGVSFRQTEKEPPTYEVTGIETAHGMAQMHQAIEKAIEKHALNVEFREARLTYSGLSAAGDITTTITITASPSSEVHLADGSRDRPWRKIRVDKEGKWTGKVDTAGVVTETGGWVYVVAIRGDLERVFRVNVLSKKQERWFDPLPFPGPKK